LDKLQIDLLAADASKEGGIANFIQDMMTCKKWCRCLVGIALLSVNHTLKNKKPQVLVWHQIISECWKLLGDQSDRYPGDFGPMQLHGHWIDLGIHTSLPHDSKAWTDIQVLCTTHKIQNVLDAGAGGAFVSALLRVVLSEQKIDVQAWDVCRPEALSFMPVLVSDKMELVMNELSTANTLLFLGWPPSNTSMASEILSLHKGAHLLYAGSRTATGDALFHAALAKSWKPLQSWSLWSSPSFESTLTWFQRNI
jgi:hypothetical protein